MATKIYTTYAQDTDITFILQDLTSGNTLLSTQVIGFYYGTPNAQDTKQYSNNGLIATF